MLLPSLSPVLQAPEHGFSFQESYDTTAEMLSCMVPDFFSLDKFTYLHGIRNMSEVVEQEFRITEGQGFQPRSWQSEHDTIIALCNTGANIIRGH
jgi:hypothetical protein